MLEGSAVLIPVLKALEGVGGVGEDGAVPFMQLCPRDKDFVINSQFNR